MTRSEVEIHRWTRSGYEQMAEAGILDHVGRFEQISPLALPEISIPVDDLLPRK